MERKKVLHVTVDKKRSHGFKLQQGRYRFDTQLPSVMVRETQQELTQVGSMISITCDRRRPWVQLPGRGLVWLSPLCGGAGWEDLSTPLPVLFVRDTMPCVSPRGKLTFWNVWITAHRKNHISPPWQPFTDLNTNSWIPFLQPQKMRAAR